MTLSSSWLDDFFRNEVTSPLVNNGTGALPNIDTFDASGAKVSAVEMTGAAPDVSGINAGISPTPGRRIHIIAKGGPVTFEEDSALSLAANRLKLGGAGSVTIPQGSAAWFVYDVSYARWILTVGSSGGGGGGFTAGGDLSGTSTVQVVQKVRGAQVGTAAGALTTGQSLRVTGGSTADWGAINLALSAAVTGLLPLTNQAAPTGSGVVLGTGGAWNAAASLGTRCQVLESFDTGSGIVVRWANRERIAIDNATSGAVNDAVSTDANSNPVETIRLTGASPVLGGIAGGYEGRMIAVYNMSSDSASATIVDEVAGSSVSNRIDTPGNATQTLPYKAGALLKYDSSFGRWRLVSLVAAAAGSTSPGGSTTQFQWNNAGAFAGSSGFFYDSTNNRPQASNGYSLKPGSFDMVLTGTPTAARTITFPDATDTVMLLAAAQSPTNKTIVAASNTITDTSAALGDLFRFDGTRFARFARGAASTILGANSGGTDIAFALLANANVSASAAIAASKLAPPGTTGQISYNASSVWTGTANITTDGTGFILGSSGYIQHVSGGATAGLIRLATGALRQVAVIDDGAGGLRNDFISINSTTSAFNFGFNAYNGTFEAATITMVAGGASRVTIGSTSIGIGLPRIGNSTPYSSEGEVTISFASVASVTLTSAQYSRSIWLFSSSSSSTASTTITVPAPGTADASYMKVVRFASASSTTSLVFTTGSGTTATLTTNTGGGAVMALLAVSTSGCRMFGYGASGAFVQ